MVMDKRFSILRLLVALFLLFGGVILVFYMYFFLAFGFFIEFFTSGDYIGAVIPFISLFVIWISTIYLVVSKKKNYKLVFWIDFLIISIIFLIGFVTLLKQ